MNLDEHVPIDVIAEGERALLDQLLSKRSRSGGPSANTGASSLYMDSGDGVSARELPKFNPRMEQADSRNYTGTSRRNLGRRELKIKRYLD